MTLCWGELAREHEASLAHPEQPNEAEQPKPGGDGLRQGGTDPKNITFCTVLPRVRAALHTLFGCQSFHLQHEPNITHLLHLGKDQVT